ncbi:MAG: ribulose-phosphate 3-epimerase [Deltaproteobacteria bacterium]|nr:MAG: ribulose-phosphate 3-epimerase [Deltaproteobacteria bacterium]
MCIIAPSILSADFTRLGEEIRDVEAAGADWIHIDVMDGHFVPNLTYGPIIVEAAKQVSSAELDVHLMITSPDALIPAFAAAGADWISVHAEACPHLHRSLALIREKGSKAGVALNPSTPLSMIEWVLKDLDFVLLMSVNPGFGGQSFIASSVEKIRQLKAMIRSQAPEVLIQVDGGINAKTIGSVARAGADSFVAGSAIFGTGDYAATIAEMRRQVADATGKTV